MGSFGFSNPAFAFSFCDAGAFGTTTDAYPQESGYASMIVTWRPGEQVLSIRQLPMEWQTNLTIVIPVDLELVETRTFDSRVVYLRHRVARQAVSWSLSGGRLITP